MDTVQTGGDSASKRHFPATFGATFHFCTKMRHGVLLMDNGDLGGVDVTMGECIHMQYMSNYKDCTPIVF